MKTDKFDDAVRRKLESVEPPFRERDWSQMQAFMHRHGYPPAWAGASQWLVPLGAAAAVTGLIVATVWQFRTNQELSQSLQTLSQTVARLEVTQAKLIERQTQTDTVYVTNFTKTPTSGNTGQSRTGQPASQPGSRGLSSVLPDERYTRQPATSVAQSENRTARQALGAVTDQRPRRAEPDAQPTGSPEGLPPVNPPVSTNRLGQRLGYQPQATNQSNEPTPNPEVTRQRPVVGEPTGAGTQKSDLAALAPVNTGSRSNRAGQTKRLAGRGTPEPGAATSPSMDSRAEFSQPYAATRASDNRAVAERVESPSPLADSQTESIKLLAIRPMSPIAPDSAYYVENMAKRIRRIRSLLPAPVSVLPTNITPTDIASSRPVSGAVRLRLGLSGETGSGQRAMGVYSELVIDQHWSIGIGLNQTDRQGGQYISDDHFKRETNKGFPRIHGKGSRPIHDIVGIDQQFTLWQVPINLSYRALVGKGFAIVPSVGMDINASARETVTFLYRHGPYERYLTGQLTAEPYDWPNAYTLSLGAERSWKHIVLQAGPVLSTPTKTMPDPINSVSLGLRARALLQF
ncbi:MAG: hypothetical protein H7Z72_25780 [Bacteroidetes bacterium]|nr:hypothetical protein [Fibrella sp.]